MSVLHGNAIVIVIQIILYVCVVVKCVSLRGRTAFLLLLIPLPYSSVFLPHFVISVLLPSLLTLTQRRIWGPLYVSFSLLHFCVLKYDRRCH